MSVFGIDGVQHSRLFKMQEPEFHRELGTDLVPRIMEALAGAGFDAATFAARVKLQSFQMSVSIRGRVPAVLHSPARHLLCKGTCYRVVAGGAGVTSAGLQKRLLNAIDLRALTSPVLFRRCWRSSGGRWIRRRCRRTRAWC